ncbi:MAG: hypothetical protein KH351_11645 [Staphylococcus aureus]|nr:hypothetical protein [Staphylococcus aureus]
MNYIKRTIIVLILFVVVSPINSPKTIADNKYSEIQDDKFQLQPESSTLNWTNSMRIDIVNLRK